MAKRNKKKNKKRNAFVAAMLEHCKGGAMTSKNKKKKKEKFNWKDELSNE